MKDKNKLTIKDLNGDISDKIEFLIQNSKDNTGFVDTMPYSVGKFLDKVRKGEADKELKEDIEFTKKLVEDIKF